MDDKFDHRHSEAEFQPYPDPPPRPATSGGFARPPTHRRWAGGPSWFGRLPGDIRIERENVRIYIPVISMLLVSVVGTILLSIVQYLFRR